MLENWWFHNMDEIDIESLILKRRNLVGLKVREFREKKGFSQDVLAEIMGVSRSTISKIENGKFSFSIDYLSKLSLFLDFQISLEDK